MARYEKVFTLEPMLYAQGSPVIIEAGALQKDNTNSSIIAQLKFKNISVKTIKALTVRITPLDTIGNVLGDMVEHQYLDLSVNRDENFGSKDAIVLPNNTTRAIKVSVTNVVFDDNSNELLNEQEWLPIPNQNEMNLDDIETEYFYLSFGIKSKKYALKHCDLWLCSCGAINNINEDKCHCCNNSFEVFDNINFEELHNEAYYEKAQMLSRSKSNEDVKRANQLFDGLNGYKNSKLNTENNNRNIKKRKTIVTVVISVIIALLIFVVILTKLIIPSIEYNKANKLIKNQEYSEAGTILEELDGFKNSEEILDDIFVPLTKEKISKMKYGDCFTLGTHLGSNIEWIVISNDEKGNVLALSKYIIDSQYYDDKQEETTWENSSIRSWLNNDLYESAFNKEEKELIAEHKNKNHDTVTRYGTGNGGNDTNDKITLLSFEEYYSYLCDESYGYPNKDITQAKAINVDKFENYIYVVPHEFQGRVFEDEGFSDWWLRSPGGDNSRANVVSYSGYTFYDSYGDGIGPGVPLSSATEKGVRPAIWINTNL